MVGNSQPVGVAVPDLRDSVLVKDARLRRVLDAPGPSLAGVPDHDVVAEGVHDAKSVLNPSACKGRW